MNRKQFLSLMFVVVLLGGAGLALGVERVEALVQPFLRAFAGVYRAAQHLHFATSFRRPKNRGPFQRLPVIWRAISDKLFQRLPS